MDPEISLTITCMAAPFQAEGTICGVPFEFRSRHERWAVWCPLQAPGAGSFDDESGHAGAGDVYGPSEMLKLIMKLEPWRTAYLQTYDTTPEDARMSGMSETPVTELTSDVTPAPPVPLLQGTFALYQHQGGYLIAWKKKGESDTRHLPLPAMIINMAAQMSGRTPEDLINELAASVTG